MRSEEFLAHVAERAGLPGLVEAERTVRTVLGVLRERLTWPVLQALAEDLPAPLAESLLSPGPHEDFDLAGFHARVAYREGIGPGFAVEHTGVVCQALAEALSPAVLHRLREALPEPIGALFHPHEPVERFEHVHLDPSHRTLAEGRPGSRHPLAEARPERAQSDSVVRADNPHGDTKLSSATGLTQEREQVRAAAAPPGSRTSGGFRRT